MPNTEPSRLSAAYRKPFFGCARHIGASITSGATGKMKASTKLSSIRISGARGCRDQMIARSYRGWKSFMRSSSSEGPGYQRNEHDATQIFLDHAIGGLAYAHQ